MTPDAKTDPPKVDPPATTDKTAPKVTFVALASKLGRTAFFKKGLTFSVTFDEPVKAIVQLIGTLKGAHVARANDLVLAEKVLKVGAGTSKVTFKLGAAQKKLIGKTREADACG